MALYNTLLVLVLACCLAGNCSAFAFAAQTEVVLDETTTTAESK